jgi:hypothetical protein
MLLVYFELLEKIRVAVTVNGSHFDSRNFPFAIDLAKRVFVEGLNNKIRAHPAPCLRLA